MVEAAHFTSLLRSDTRRRCTCCAFRRSRYQRMVHSDAMTAYAELHCHSAYSFLDGASPPDEILAAAHSLGYPALALTDRNGIYGSLAFAHAAQPLGIQAITGAEVTLSAGCHLILLAETAKGYTNLCRLLPEAPLGAERLDPRLPLAQIEER